MATAPTDLAVTAESVWVLDASSQQAAVLNLSRQGVLIAQYTLPEQLSTADGLSGITISPQNELLIEQENGTQHYRFDPKDSAVFVATSGYTTRERSIDVYSEGLGSNNPSTGYIEIGTAKIPVSVVNALGGLHILGFAPDGSFYIALEEVALRDTIIVDQRIRHYTSDGILLGEARSPVQAQYTYVPHALAVGTDGNVYFLATRPAGANIQRLRFVADLAPVIPPLAPVSKADGVSGEAVPQSFVDPATVSSGDSIQACTITRDAIMVNANAFINNSISLSDDNINGVCDGRTKPHYLGNAGQYTSVPYDWGGKVSLAIFNTKMGEGKQAGDIDFVLPLASHGVESCSVGVDCSGFIARVWDVPAFDPTCCENVGTNKLKTYSNRLSSISELQRGDILSDDADTHVALFDRFGDNGFYSYESTTSWDVDRVYRGFREWTWVTNNSYRPYSLKSEYLCASDTDDGRTLTSGQTLNGTINPANDSDTYYFDASQGQRATIRMNRTSGSLDSYLNLYAPSGTRIAYDDDSGGINNNSLINQFTLPAGGRYWIVSHSYYGGSTGGYSLNLTLESGGGACTDNATFVGQSAYPTVQAGQSFQIYFEVRNTGTCTWSQGNNYYLSNINGTTLGANGRQELGSNVAPNGTKRWTINMTAPSSPGTYRTQWMVKRDDRTFGPNMFIDVTVPSASDPDDNRTLTSGQTLNGTINPANDSDTYYFDASQGQRATIRMNSVSGSSLDSYLYLYAPNGTTPIAENDDGGGGVNSLINQFTLPAGGRYRIVSKSYNGGSSGGYTLNLTLESAGSTCTPGANGVVLYEHGNHTGRCITFTGDDSDFNNDSFNDIASSIRFVGSYATGWEAQVYEHSYYGGVSTTYRGNDTDFGNDTIGHDRASSIRIRRTSTGSGNLVLNKSAYATSWESASYPPYKGNDGNTGTRWSSQVSSNLGPQWWWTDMGSRQTFDRVVVRWEAAYAAHYFIGWSDDGTNFSGYWYNLNSAGSYSHNLGTQTARYLGILMDVRAPRMNNYSFWEYEAYRGTRSAESGEEESMLISPDGEVVILELSENAANHSLYLPAIGR